MATPKNPIQPVLLADDGIVRFKENAIVRYLLDWATPKGMSLNELALMPFSKDDRTQFAQLIGYSVSGAGDLSYFDPKVAAVADRASAKLLKAKKKRR